MRAVINCQMGSIRFDLGRDPEVEVTLPDDSKEALSRASHEGSGYDGEIEALLEAIRRGDASPPVRLEDAAMTATVLQAEIKSLGHGGERCKI